LQSSDLIGVRRLPAVPEVPIELQAQPKLGRHAKHPFEPQRRIGSDGAFAADDFIQSRKRNPQPDGARGLADSERAQEFLLQDLAGMRGRPLPGQSPAANGNP